MENAKSRKGGLLKKYQLYEASVQDPEQQIRVFHHVYSENFGRLPKLLKEDFSGTFWISSEWVKRGTDRQAYALDIEDAVLKAGKALHYGALSRDQQKRLHVLNHNVLRPIGRKVDVVAACNFSYFIFQERQQLLEYFDVARRSLRKEGVFLLETAGGPGFVETPLRERRMVPMPQASRVQKKGKSRFQYTWHQKSFDPMHRRGLYSIHFRLPDGKTMQDAFVYDWRIWTIPEVADVLREVGFDDVQVYWEQDKTDDEGYSVYHRQAVAKNDYHTWIAYITGVVR